MLYIHLKRRRLYCHQGSKLLDFLTHPTSPSSKGIKWLFVSTPITWQHQVAFSKYKKVTRDFGRLPLYSKTMCDMVQIKKLEILFLRCSTSVLGTPQDTLNCLACHKLPVSHSLGALLLNSAPSSMGKGLNNSIDQQYMWRESFCCEEFNCIYRLNSSDPLHPGEPRYWPEKMI